MRKIFLNLTVALTVTSSTIPLTACTFNFYVDRSKDKIKNLLANETSNVIKSLVVSSQLDSDTKQTIDDMFNQEPQNNIANQSGGSTNLKNWGDFSQHWGDNGQIINNGFDQDKFIVANGKGKLTQQITSKNNLNNTLSSLSYFSSLNIFTNDIIYPFLEPNTSLHNTIMTYLKMFQNPDTLPDSMKPLWPLINNLINNYQNSFLTPITNLLNDLVSGWSNIPKTQDDLKKYMEQWKDGKQPYSQWMDQGKWTLSDTAKDLIANWTPNDYVSYRGGTILNYVFKKIGTESNGTIPSQYLGEIISANLDNTDNLVSVLKPYLSALTTSPAYILMIIEGALPIIKQTLLQMPDTSQGIEHLTLGAGYPTPKDPNILHSWNLLDIFNTIKNLTTNPDALAKVVDNLLSSSFLYDIQINYSGIKLPLPTGLNFKEDTKKQLITTITGFLTGQQFQSIFGSIYDFVKKLNDQFTSGGIDLNLKDLKNLLIGNNGLLLDLIEVTNKLSTIIKPDHGEITEADFNTLYTSLGGIIPPAGQSPSPNFKPNSFLDQLKLQFAREDSVLRTLVRLIYNSDGTHKGIAQLLIDNNKAWIKENYTNYFDIDNHNTKISNIKFNESTINNYDVIDLNYYLTFKLKERIFTFYVKGISKDNITTFTGTHNFKFSEIDLIS